MPWGRQGTAEPDVEVPLLFNIQNEGLSAFLDLNVKAAKHPINITSPDFVVHSRAPQPCICCCDAEAALTSYGFPVPVTYARASLVLIERSCEALERPEGRQQEQLL